MKLLESSSTLGHLFCLYIFRFNFIQAFGDGEMISNGSTMLDDSSALRRDVSFTLVFFNFLQGKLGSDRHRWTKWETWDIGVWVFLIDRSFMMLLCIILCCLL